MVSSRTSPRRGRAKFVDVAGRLPGSYTNTSRLPASTTVGTLPGHDRMLPRNCPGIVLDNGRLSPGRWPEIDGSYLAIAAALPLDIALSVTRTFAGYSMGTIALII